MRVTYVKSLRSIMLAVIVGILFMAVCARGADVNSDWCPVNSDHACVSTR